MVLAGVLVKENDIKKLKEIGVKDSKLLTPKQRELLFAKIIKIVKSYKIMILSPQQIDNAVKSKTSNLNMLEAVTFAQIINYLKPDEAIVDCPSNNIPAYTNTLNLYLKQRINLKCEHKADVNHPVVSAASILAKVTRDNEIEKIKKRIDIDFGSGYPADQKTKYFLKNNWNKYPEIFRKSWSSYENYSEKKQKTLKDF